MSAKCPAVHALRAGTSHPTDEDLSMGTPAGNRKNITALKGVHA